MGDVGYILSLIRYCLKYFNHIANPIICITASEKFRYEAQYIIFCGNVKKQEVAKDGDMNAYRESKRYSVVNPHIRPSIAPGGPGHLAGSSISGQSNGSRSIHISNPNSRPIINVTGQHSGQQKSSYEASPMTSSPSYQSSQYDASASNSSRLPLLSNRPGTISTSTPSKQYNYNRNAIAATANASANINERGSSSASKDENLKHGRNSGTTTTGTSSNNNSTSVEPILELDGEKVEQLKAKTNMQINLDHVNAKPGVKTARGTINIEKENDRELDAPLLGNDDEVDHKNE